jgi:hypothetical protein
MRPWRNPHGYWVFEHCESTKLKTAGSLLAGKIEPGSIKFLDLISRFPSSPRESLFQQIRTKKNKNIDFLLKKLLFSRNLEKTDNGRKKP